MERISPVNLYFHSNGQEWRARYLDNGSKKAKHFSCNRYNHKVSYFLGNVYMRLLAETKKVPSNEDVNLWLGITRYFKALNESRCSDFSASLNSKAKFLNENTHNILNMVISDIENSYFVSEPSISFVPVININELKKNSKDLFNYIKKFKVVSNDKGATRNHKTDADKKQKITLDFILSTLLNKSQPINKTRSYIDDYLKILRDINDKDIKEVLGTINEFHKESNGDIFERNTYYSGDGSDEFSSSSEDDDNDDDYQPFKKARKVDRSSSATSKISMSSLSNLVKRHEDIINKLAKGDAKYHGPSLKYPIATFNHDTLNEENILSYLYNRPYIRNNSLYDFSNMAYTSKLNIKEFDRQDDELEYADDKRTKLAEYRRVCNEKLQSLIEQTDMLDSPSFDEVVSRCIDDDSKAMSDLESLIQIGNRNNIQEQGNGGMCYFGNKMYDIQDAYSNKHVNVKYVNGKIIPSSTVHLHEELLLDDENNENRIILSGRDKMDIHFDLLVKNIGRVKGSREYIEQALKSIRLIDEKIEIITKQRENMQRALFKYKKNVNDNTVHTNDIEETLNLEMLHLVCETLNDTKLKLILQVYNNIDAQINIIHSILPEKYFNIFNRILYGQHEDKKRN